MARHRSFRGLETIPGLSGIAGSLKGSVKSTDVLIGVAAFLGVHFGVKYALNKLAEKQIKVPDLVIRFTPLVTAFAAALALPMIGKKVLKLNPAKVSGLVVGAIGSGVALVAMQEAKTMFPALADYNDLQLSGLILRDPALSGLLLDDPAMNEYDGAPDYTRTDFAALAAAGDNEDSEFDY